MKPTPMRGHDHGDGWHLTPRRRWGQRALGLLVLVLLGIPLTQAAWERSPWFLLGLPLLVALAAVSWVPRGGEPNAAARVLTSAPALAMPIRPGTWAGIAVLGTIGVYLIGLSAVALVAAVRGDYAFLIGFVLLGSFGTLFAGSAWVQIQQRTHGAGGIIVDSDGICLVTPRRTVWSLPWSMITGIEARWIRWNVGRRSPVNPVMNLMHISAPGWNAAPRLGRLGAIGGGPNLSPQNLAMDPYVVFEVLRHYIENPADRGELGTEACLARVDAITHKVTRSAND